MNPDRHTSRAASIWASRSPTPATSVRSRFQVAARAGLRNSSPGRGLPVGQVHVRRRGPLRLEQLPYGLDGRPDVLHARVAVLGVPDGVLQDVGQGLRAVVPKEEHPGVEGAGNGRREGSRTGYEIQTESPVVLDRRARGGDTLAAQHPHLAARRGQQDGHLTGGSVEVRFHDVQDERPGDGRVVRVAAVLQDGHRRLRGQPVRGGHHAEGALERGSGGEVHISPRWSRACAGARLRSPWSGSRLSTRPVHTSPPYFAGAKTRWAATTAPPRAHSSNGRGRTTRSQSTAAPKAWSTKACRMWSANRS